MPFPRSCLSSSLPGAFLCGLVIFRVQHVLLAERAQCSFHSALPTVGARVTCLLRWLAVDFFFPALPLHLSLPESLVFRRLPLPPDISRSSYALFTFALALCAM